jgi:uncharacterized damage-inducible protein DinB
MSEIERIDDQFRRAFEGPAWHGPSVKEALTDVTAEQAGRRPVAGAHTIWELVHHLAAWNSTVRRRLEGEGLQEPVEGDWPPVSDTSETAWQASLGGLDDSYNQLRKVMATVSDSRLDEAIMEGGSTVYATLHGNVHHNLYHAGQIMLLKKARA